MLVIDLDDFKTINDQHGHAVGDVVLKEIGRRLRASVRAVDYVGRIGGDEFMLILPETDPPEVTRVAERIRLAIATAIIQHSNGTVTLTASIAALLPHQPTCRPSTNCSPARTFCSRARRAKARTASSFQSSDFDDTERRLRAQADMCSNLTRGQARPHASSSRSSGSTTIVPIGYEFLSRYANGTFEMPENFFRLCAERNVLTLVDHACLRASIQAAMQLPPYARFHLNIFPTTLLAIPVEHLLDLFPNPIPAGYVLPRDQRAADHRRSRRISFRPCRRCAKRAFSSPSTTSASAAVAWRVWCSSSPTSSRSTSAA